MKKQSRKRRILTEFFVLRPWGFVIFLVLGTALFSFVSLHIKIPVYTTVETYVEIEDNRIRLALHNQKFQMDKPIFLYHSKDESLEKIMAYQFVGGYIVAEDSGIFSNGEKIKIDIQTKEITLLKNIFAEGGNT